MIVDGQGVKGGYRKEGPASAPVQRGDRLGTLVHVDAGQVVRSEVLVARARASSCWLGPVPVDDHRGWRLPFGALRSLMSYLS